MKNFVTFKILLISVLILKNGIGHGQQRRPELAVQNVTIFDSRTKKLHPHRTIVINAGTVVAVLRASKKVDAARVIDGRNRLAVPGFIDAHNHLRNVYGSLEQVEKNPAGLDRRKLSDTYLRYGTTTVVDMGQPEKWLGTSLAWEKNPLPDFPNLFVSGGAIVSEEEGRKTYMNRTYAHGYTSAWMSGF